MLTSWTPSLSDEEGEHPFDSSGTALTDCLAALLCIFSLFLQSFEQSSFFLFVSGQAAVALYVYF